MEFLAVCGIPSSHQSTPTDDRFPPPPISSCVCVHSFVWPFIHSFTIHRLMQSVNQSMYIPPSHLSVSISPLYLSTHLSICIHKYNHIIITTIFIWHYISLIFTGQGFQSIHPSTLSLIGSSSMFSPFHKTIFHLSICHIHPLIQSIHPSHHPSFCLSITKPSICSASHPPIHHSAETIGSRCNRTTQWNISSPSPAQTDSTLFASLLTAT